MFRAPALTTIGVAAKRRPIDERDHAPEQTADCTQAVEQAAAARVGCPYSTSFLEGVFPETQLLVIGVPGNPEVSEA